MMMHALHPTLEDPPVLYDECEECARQALRPFAFLDEGNMRALWARMVLVEHELESHYRSGTEAKAAKWCYEVAIFLERFAGIDPWQPLDELRFTAPFGR